MTIGAQSTLHIVGLLGGIGAGKSTVGAMLIELGAEAVAVDELVQNVSELPWLKREMSQMWGQSLLRDGKIDTDALAELIVRPNGSDDLATLERLIQPIMRAELKRAINRLMLSGARTVVLDVPRLWELGLYQECDVLVFVDTPVAIRHARVMANRNWSEAAVEQSEQFVGELAAKRSAAHYVVHNRSDLDTLRSQVRTIWQSFSASASDVRSPV
jgi:dephospho-CoA kinase